MYHFLIRGRNCALYLKECLDSVKAQTHTDWRAHVVLDAPTDISWQVAMGEQDLGINLHLNRKRCGLAYNMYWGFKLTGAKPEDVVCVLDADDYLHYDALRVVHHQYKKHPNTLITHGSYIKTSKGRTTKVSKPYPVDCDPRTHKWRGSHLKTVKYKVFECIPKDYFKHKGKWLDAASDLALMIPAMEIAGMDRVRHIAKPIYYWRDNYGGNTNASLQKECDMIVRTKPKLKRVF